MERGGCKMLKRKLCEAHFEWQLSCEGPLLIADGRYAKKKQSNEKDLPDKIFISHASENALHNAILKDGNASLIALPFYVPGTSLRGPFRAQAERIIRSLIPSEPSPITACDPFESDDSPLKSCSKRFDEKAAGIPYKEVCPACKIFGCTHTASRIQFTDARIERWHSVYRDMIGIDRFSGGVYKGEKSASGDKTAGGANMRLHVLENTQFKTTVSIINFELWHLGLLAYVFRDFEEKMVSIGFGKTKGFGLVKGEMKNIFLTYPAGKDPGFIHHLGSLANGNEMTLYGLRNDSPIPITTEPVSGGLSLYQTYSIPISSKDTFFRNAAVAFNEYIKVRFKETAA
jgi:CRISPR-associated protein Csm3